MPADKAPDFFPKNCGEYEKKSNVREKRNDKHIHKKHASGERERGEKNFVGFKPRFCFHSGAGPKVFEGNLSAY